MKSRREEPLIPKPKRTRYMKKQPKVFYSAMNEIVRNQGLQHISTFIFKCLDIDTLLNCREVSKLWRNVLENPRFWYKMGIQNKMSEVYQIEWKKLIEHFQTDNTEKKVTKYLIKTFIGVKPEINHEFHGLYHSPLSLACKYGETGETNILKAFKTLKVLEEVTKNSDSEIKAITKKKYLKRDPKYRFFEPFSDECRLPLHIACENGHLEIVEILSQILEDFSDLNIIHLSALDYAVSGNHHHLVEFMIDKRFLSDYEALDDYSFNIFHRVAKFSDPKMFNLLSKAIGRTEYDEGIIAKPNENASVLSEACKAGKLGNVKCIYNWLRNYRDKVNDSIDIFEPDENRDGPLYVAAGKGHFEIVKYLISKGANPYAPNLQGYTPFHEALFHVGGPHIDRWREKHMIKYSEGHLKIIKYLADLTYNKDRPCDLNYLHIPMKASNSIEIVETLIKCAKEETLPQKISSGSIGSIHMAAKYGNIEALKYLLPLAKGMEIQPHWECGLTPMCFAAGRGHLEVVKFLSKFTKNPNAPDQYKNAPIHYAILMAESPLDFIEKENIKKPLHLTKDQIEIVKFLASLCKNPNVANEDGDTPVHLSLLCNNGMEILPYLIQKEYKDKFNYWKL